MKLLILLSLFLCSSVKPFVPACPSKPSGEVGSVLPSSESEVEFIEGSEPSQHYEQFQKFYEHLSLQEQDECAQFLLDCTDLFAVPQVQELWKKYNGHVTHAFLVEVFQTPHGRELWHNHKTIMIKIRDNFRRL